MRFTPLIYLALSLYVYVLIAACASGVGDKQVHKDTLVKKDTVNSHPVIAPGQQLTPLALQRSKGDQNKKTVNATNTSETFGRYLVKSGYVEMETHQEIGADYHSTSRVKKTFDNYGRDELMEITNEMNVNGEKKTETERMLMRSGWMHELRKDFIAARQHPYTQFDLLNMEFSLLDDEAMHLYNIKNMGTIIKDGRTCAHFFIDYHSKDQNMKGDLYTYKNLFYGMDVTMGDAVLHSVITHFDEDVAVDQKKFDIPPGYRVIDTDNTYN